MTLTETLAKLSVLNRDNGQVFTDTSRLDAISECLEGSTYTRIKGRLFHLYSPIPLSSINKPVVIISSHVDCEKNIKKCFSEILPDGLMHGTFDNSITNAAILHLMLQKKLSDNVLIAFTGDEERNSRGANEVMSFSQGRFKIKHVIILDVTDEGFQEEADFTIENNFWGCELGKKVITSAENSAYNWRFVPSDPDEIPPYVDKKFLIPFEAAEDESWEYDENDVDCFCLCLPVKGNMHSNKGVYARQKSFEHYTDILSKISKI